MQVPPEVLRYLQGVTPECRQFDFLIGEWEVAATRYQPDGAVLMNYRAAWSARSLNDGRIVMDDFRAYGPTGVAVSSFVTLRTYSHTAQRWELVGLGAMQSAAPTEWYGHWRDGEMQLQAIGKNPLGTTVKTRIRFSDIEENKFSWESTYSLDEGSVWLRGASLIATRA